MFHAKEIVSQSGSVIENMDLYMVSEKKMCNDKVPSFDVNRKQL